MRKDSDARDFAAATLVLSTVFLLLVVPLTFFCGNAGVSAAFDEANTHLPVILTMAKQWPQVDIVNYASATGPLFHLFMASVAHYLTDNLIILRILNSILGLLLVLLVFWHGSRLADAKTALVLCLPLALSAYVLASAIWLDTDNAALLFAVVTLGGAAFMPPSPWRITAWSLSATLAVGVRQIYLWLVVPIILSAVAGSPINAGRARKQSVAWSNLLAGMTVVIPLALMIAFVWIWHGLTPPCVVHNIHRRDLVAVSMALSLVGCFGPFYLQKRPELKANDIQLWLVIGVALISTLVFPTDYSYDEGRWGGVIWDVVRVCPALWHRSLLFPPLAIVGATVLLQMWREILKTGKSADAVIILVSSIGWLIAQSANHQLYQRYFEPLILINIIWLSAISASRLTRLDRRQLWVGPIALLAIQICLSFVKIYLPVLRCSVGF
jgi:hypothetical protein